MFKKVDVRQSLPKMEEEVLKYWSDNKTFEKSVSNRAEAGAPVFSFYDGPPFATGLPHYGHIVGQTLKDAVPRYWTMRGFQVERRWGWDCHGLPIENIAEKALGVTRKKDIEVMGVEKYNEFCRTTVLQYMEEWKKVTMRLGRWADRDNAYKTMDKDYMESIWWVFKQLFDKGLIYESYRIMHVCTRCETTLSQSEVSEGYMDVKDLSVTAKFELADEPGTFVLAWTTTPWTLPGNVALAVGKDIEYVKVKSENEFLILAKARLQEVMKEKEYEIVAELLGKDLLGLKYIPPFDAYKKVRNPKVALITGPGGSGKTALSEQLQKRYGVTCIDGDYAASQVVDPADIWIESRLADLKKAQDAVIDAAKKAYERGENVVIDFIIYKDFSQFIQKCRGVFGEDLCVRILLPDEQTIIQRDCERECWTTGKDRIREVTQLIQQDASLKEYIVDTSNQSLDQSIESYFKGCFSESITTNNYANGWKIVHADFVTTDMGTGIAHEAPAFGEDDWTLAKAENLPFVQHVSLDGTIKPEVKELSRMSVKSKENPQATDIEVIKYLAGKGLLFAKEKYEHSYPHCWRCDTPLISYATSSWFMKVTDVKEKALENAKEINWSPEHLKAGRFGKWLEGARDWSISRQRFWASVMPIWKCDQCAAMKVFGSVKDLEEVSGEKIDDLHKHVVDKITFSCEHCDGTMKRIPDVLDTWFDSGSMPYAQMHYMGEGSENEEKFEKSFPAQFIAEGIDQTRAWFYYLHVLGTALKGKPAFKNVIVNGIVLAEDGKKMAKKLKNYPDPMLMFDKHGADAMRLYLLSSPIVTAENLNFSEKDMSEISRNVFRMLWNSYSFFVMYAEIDGWSPSPEASAHRGQSENILDRWILSELQMVIKEVNGYMESYDMMRATRAFAPFIDHLSNWYIRRSRKRFWKSEDDTDKNNAYQTLHTVLVTLAKLMAPFTPFIAEEIYRNLTGEESVHLADYPDESQFIWNSDLNAQMHRIRAVINLGLNLRVKSGIKVRQPLPFLYVVNMKTVEALDEIIKDELNVKEIRFFDAQSDVSDKNVAWEKLGEIEVGLAITITPELELEGQAREIIRFIQETRKEAGFEVDDRIEVGYVGFESVFGNRELKAMIAKEVLAESMENGAIENPDIRKESVIDGEKIAISVRR